MIVSARSARWQFSLVTFLLLLLPSKQAAGHPTVGAYDENVIAANTVDFTASGSSMTAAEFTATVALAYDRNQGAVMDGEYVTGTSAVVEIGVSQSRSLAFDIPTNWSIGVSSITGTAISQAGAWGTDLDDLTKPRVVFEFPNAIVGGPSGERIAQVGVTALSHGQRALGTVQGIATFSGGGSQTMTAQIPMGLETHDTFFGSIAPTGQWITRFELSAYNGGAILNFMRFDDLGFVTTAFVPEPTSSWLVVVVTLLVAARCRLRA